MTVDSGEGASAEHLRAVLDGLGVAVCSRDRQRRIVYLSPRAELLTGYRAQTLVGRTCREMLCHRTAAGGELCGDNCPAEICLRDGAPSPTVGLAIRTGAGQSLAITTRFSPLRDAAGAVTGFVEAFALAGPETAGRSAGNLHVDLARRTVTVGGRPVRLTRTEFELLAYLARQPETAVSHAELLRHVWGPECEGQREYLHTFVAQLRRKLERDRRHPVFLVSEPRYGYRLCLRPRGDTEGFP